MSTGTMLKEIALLIRLDKPIGTLLLLFPTLWGLTLASEGMPDTTILLIFVGGVFLMRSAGCIINDIADRHIDLHVARTKERPLARQKISVKLALFIFFLLVALAYCLIQPLNTLTIQLAWLGLLLAVVYPFLKRLTHLPQVGLGLAFAFGIPMSFAAIQETIPLKAWVLYVAAVIWPIIYDTQYAMVDREDDKKIGVKSTAILFGQYDIVAIVCLQCLFLCLLIYLGVLFQLRAPFYVALLWVVLCFSYQLILLNTRTREAYFTAFKNNQWVGLIILLGCML
jgi:4-hydroxybenzoate polyprenyltransferase